MLLAILFSLQVLAAPAPLSGADLWSSEPRQIQPGAKGTVVVFVSAVCPCSNSHIGILKKLSAEHPKFHFVAVHANADEEIADAQNYFKTADLPFPVLSDRKGILAREFKALKTPHAFVLDPTGKILFKGGVTDSSSAPEAKKQFLADALTDLEAGRAVAVAEARPLGCHIMRGSP